MSPTPVRRTISVFGFGHGNFQTKLAADPLSPTLCRASDQVIGFGILIAGRFGRIALKSTKVSKIITEKGKLG
jgi:hypothetical protein